MGAVSEELAQVRDRGSIAPRGTRRSPEPPAGVAVGAAARDKTGLKQELGSKTISTVKIYGIKLKCTVRA